MAQTYQAVKIGDRGRIPYTPSGSAVAAGKIVVQNSVAGFATQPIADGVLGGLDTEGAFRVVKVNGAINAGAAVYWAAAGNPQGGVAGSGAATTTATGNTFLGFARETAGATDETVDLDVPGSVVTLQSQMQNAITDPGNAGALPVTATGHVDVVTAGAETRTLAAPSFRGQQLSLCMKTDGGDGVITCATGINNTGNNTITMNDAGDSILLLAIQNGANLRWRVVYNDGCTLTTV
ncbi:hypothetical protein RAS1_42170 [Phycisphaerae bacterium RAS1]|nr:hypothetical protein RAS1_42170 [Phycisphaerae bacterium RAS1]